MASEAIEIQPPFIDITGAVTHVDLGDPILAGNEGAVVTQVSNIGTVKADGDVIISVYASIDEVFDIDDVLLGQATDEVELTDNVADIDVNVVLPADMAAGQYFLLVKIDFSGDLADVDLTNNLLVGDAFEVAAPVVA